ncbi:transmembrane protein [Mycobacterium bohemicum DSM 44277]|uniref:DUF4436 domain-containing protein n=2 Tax=Mycobacterium bohemicum TaxID=56425 RepID=A0A1X1R8F0_MYCBE|nr:DUF4436 domain-containing protein [Mycobacterium bohemicum]MCV6971189.1 DUF4436 domain-containing protein [Mycobacterium bohemicum]ORV01235.1 hypothetical protein AWB93_07510 [Mycobacterium bohemicum]CPR13378.1 transmembrane protein [Mycobacterium bohemicum DSM 44277]
MKLGFVALGVAVVAAYVTSVVLYADSGARQRQAVLPASGERTTATLTVEEVQSNYSVLVANLAVSLGSALLDPQTEHLNQDVSLRVRSAATPTRREYTKGMLPGVFPVPLTIAGDIETWPFDQYQSGPIEVELIRGGEGGVSERIPVTFVNHLPGWQVVATQANGTGPYQVRMERSLSAAAFGFAILGVLVAIAAVGFFVAVQTLRDRRRFQPPMTTWYAAMLFAVVPLRNALPGSPPFGGWIDITLVLWVLVVLVISMLLYIACWWRHLKPDTDTAKPQAEAVSGSPAR